MVSRLVMIVTGESRSFQVPVKIGKRDSVKVARCRHIHGIMKNNAPPVASRRVTVETVLSCSEVSA